MPLYLESTAITPAESSDNRLSARRISARVFALQNFAYDGFSDDDNPLLINLCSYAISRSGTTNAAFRTISSCSSAQALFILTIIHRERIRQ
jgi:hypothetical protein